MERRATRKARYLSLICSAFLLLAGCKREGSIPASQSSASPKMNSKAKPPRHDEWAKIIVGSWVSKSSPPEGSPKDICATDANIDFDSEGGYFTSSDEGRWTMSGNILVTTITASNLDGNIGPPMKKLAKPIVIRSQLISYKAPILTAITEGTKEYWYLCPKSTDANP